MSHEGFAAAMAEETMESMERTERSDPDSKFNAGKNLRRITTDMTQAELRLRRMESFVTSDRYELHKELAKMERDGATS